MGRENQVVTVSGEVTAKFACSKRDGQQELTMTLTKRVALC